MEEQHPTCVEAVHAKPSRAGGVVALVGGALGAVSVALACRAAADMRYFAAGDDAPAGSREVRDLFVDGAAWRGLGFLVAGLALGLVAALAALIGRRATVGKLGLVLAGLVVAGDVGAFVVYRDAPVQALPNAADRKAEAAREAVAKVTPAELAWMLGHRLALSSLGRGRAPDAIVDRVFASARETGDALGVRLPPPPVAGATRAESGANAVHYLLRIAGPETTAWIEAQHGARAARLFDLAVRLRVLALLYEPGDDGSRGLAQTLVGHAVGAELPLDLLDGLTNAVARRADFAIVEEEIVWSEEAIGATVAGRPRPARPDSLASSVPTEKPASAPLARPVAVVSAPSSRPAPPHASPTPPRPPASSSAPSSSTDTDPRRERAFRIVPKNEARKSSDADRYVLTIE